MKIYIKLIVVSLIAFHTLDVTGQQGTTKTITATTERTGYVVLKNLETRIDTNQMAANQINRVPSHTKTKRPLIKTNRDLTPDKPGFLPELIVFGRQNKTDQVLLNETPCITYPGLNQNGSIPPDVSSAVGFDHLFLCLNDGFRISDKYGATLQEGTEGGANGFWSPIDQTDLFDPVITYDPYEKRWIFVICTDRRTASSAFLIAVSTSPDPLGGWHFYRWDADNDDNQWFDYPSVGFNKNWIVVNGNIYSNVDNALATVNRTWVINKAQTYAGGNAGATIYERSDYSTISPARVYDPTQNDIWCATNDDVDDNDIRFFKIGGTSTSPTFSEEGYVSIAGDWGKGGMNIAPQSGSSQLIEPGDHRMLSVVWRNGKLYTAQTIFLPSGVSPTTSTIQLVSANPAAATIYEAIRFSTSSTAMYGFPFIAVNTDNDIVISCSKFTSTTFPSACVLVRRSGGSWVEQSYKTGEAAYINQYIGSNLRWGDYTSAHVDPSDDRSIWLASEYARPQNGTAGRWGTWWAKICSGICTAVVDVTTTQNNGIMRKWEAGSTINASSTIQSGADIKLDAGVRIVLLPNFKALAGSKLRAFIEGCNGAQ